ncbi:DgyrCDS578 [Dimorphilus gyrociliatus]|uniref:DgyrCDS578 n=1 Tax=Dimorphilus gyrociliatus TaxID=2664684 RepID=A0A7I8V9I9_9ANNE|nr:DgyrCDS578 [Dimorphilus gyrociliatus]
MNHQFNGIMTDMLKPLVENIGTMLSGRKQLVKDVKFKQQREENDYNRLMEDTRLTARRISAVVIDYVADGSDNSSTDTEKAVIRSVMQVLKGYEPTLQHMAEKVDVEESEIEKSIKSVAQNMFEDHSISHGRLATFFAFCGVLSRYYVNSGRKGHVDRIKETVTEYTEKEFCEWIVENGGWQKFEDYFPDPNSIEKFIFKTGILLSAISFATLAFAHIIHK